MLDFTEVHERYWSWLASNAILARYPGVASRDPAALDRYAAGSDPGSGGKALARFAIAVWNPHHKWKCGAFTVADVGGLDPQNREWVAAWFKEPWWP